MIIGRNRKEAIDWVQDQINYGSRPLAEMAYHELLDRGLLVESNSEVSAPDDLNPTAIKSAGRDAYARREHRTVLQARRARSSARRSTHSLSRQMKWTAPAASMAVSDQKDGDT